jgi:hypothetical protein
MTPFLYLWSGSRCTCRCSEKSQVRRVATGWCSAVSLAGNPDVVLAGLVESNLDHREVAGLEDVLVFGHDSLDLYTWRSTTDEFQILDLVPRGVMETVPSFDALLSAALRRCLTS